MRFNSIPNLMLGGLLALATTMAGCGTDDESNPGDAVIVGQVEAPLHNAGERPRMRINGMDRDIQLDADRGFAVRDVPAGDVTIEFEHEGSSGSVTVANVQAGEVIEVLVSTNDAGQLNIRIERRAMPAAAQPERRQNLHYSSKDSVHQLRAGTYTGNMIIDAKNVTVLGARDRACDGENATILDGDLIIRAKDAHVVDVVVLGRIIVEDGAKHARILDTCAGWLHGHDHDSDDHSSDDHSHDNNSDDDS